MKKQISMILVLALLTVLYGGAFADTLQLPGSLTTIEAESFSDNPALDEVSVAWGTERIESRAFASSGVKKIYIPATVTAIADDAFAGTSVTICSAADSYARQYADTHGLAWEDSGSSSCEAAAVLLEIANTPVEGGKLELWEYLSTEGVTDLEELAEIEEYNAFVAEINPLIEDYTAVMEDMSETAEAIADRLSDVSASRKNGVATLSMDGFNLMVDEVLAQGADFTAAEETSSGAIKLTAPDGKVGYLAISGDALILSRSPAVANGLAMRNDAAQNWRVTLENLINSVRDTTVFIKDQEIGSAITKAEDDALLAISRMEKMEKTKVKHRGRDWHNKYNHRRNQLRQAQSNLSRLRAASGAIGALSAGLSAWNIKLTFEKWDELIEIADHQHPTADDMSQAAHEESEKLSKNIHRLSMLYALSVSVDLVNVVTGVLSLASAVAAVITAVTGAGAPLAAALATMSAACTTLNLITLAASLVTGIWSGFLENDVWDSEDKLHTFICGYVTDESTGEALAGVTITNGEITVSTTGKGEYRMYPMPGTYTLVFSKDGYEDNDYKISLEIGEQKQKDVEMTNGIPIDEEHFPDEAFRAAVSARDEDENEKLSKKERTGGNLFVNEAANLDGIDYFKELEGLKLTGCGITEFRLGDYEGLQQLHWLDFQGGEITNVDASNHEALETLTFGQTEQLERINASGSAKLFVVETTGHHLSSLDVSGCEKLQYLFCQDNQLTSLDLSNLEALENVRCQGNQLSSLNVNGCTALQYLFCQNNQLTHLQLNSCQNLELIDFTYNPLSGTLYLSTCPNVFVQCTIQCINEGTEYWYNTDSPLNLGTNLTAIYVNHSSFFYTSREAYSNPEHRYRGIIK